jgi:phage/plasmid-associated DNA primase
MLPTRFILACNKLPSFGEPSGTLAARLSILDYNVSFEVREDRSLDEKLLAEISALAIGPWKDMHG